MPDTGTQTAPAPAAQKTANSAAIASIAMAVPENVVPNSVISERLGVKPDWIETRTGVRSRHHALPEERLSDLAAKAGRLAMDRAGVEPEEIDLLLVGTMTADEVTPNAAPLVAHTLGLTRAGTVDIGAACTAFVSALGLASGQIESGRAETVLVIGADLMSRVTNPDDRSTAGLFGDGAGAAVVRASEDGSVGPVILGADGAQAGLVQCPITDRLVVMNGHDTFKHAIVRLREATEGALEASHNTLDDIDLFIYHQANSRIIVAVGEDMDLPSDRVIDCVETFGNTSGGSIPIALAYAHEHGRLDKPSKVLLAAFGAGFTWGATVIEWSGKENAHE